MTVTATTTVKTELRLTPALKRKLSVYLNTHAQIAAQMREAKEALDSNKAAIEALFIAAGEGNALIDGVDIEGFKLKHVHPITSKLDRKKLMDAGVSLAQLEEGTVTRPGKPYIKLTPPGAKDDE